MKYLQIYENFDNAEYYEEISIYTFIDLRNKSLDIDEAEFDKINSVLSEFNPNALKIKTWPDFVKDPNIKRDVYVQFYIPNKGTWGYIHVLSDEYYIIHITNKEGYYKCDQIEGLKKLLKDKI